MQHNLIHDHHYPSCLLAYRAATELLHPCLSLASLWMFFISASTVLHQIVIGWPHFCFPSGVHWIATSVMELASLRSTCPIQHHRFLVMMVSISSYWHCAKMSQLETVLGQKMCWIFWRLLVWKDNSLARSCTSSTSTLIHTEKSTIRSSGRASA